MRKAVCPNCSAYDKLLDILGYKDYSSQEVFDKLIAKGYDEKNASEAVARAVGNGLINDGRYAESIALKKMHSQGKRAVEYELRRHGISPSMAEQTVERVFEDHDASEDIVPEMRRRMKGLDMEDAKVRNRVFGAFARRGYDFEDINKAYRICRNEND